jgi:hypothetical protein
LKVATRQGSITEVRAGGRRQPEVAMPSEGVNQTEVAPQMHAKGIDCAAQIQLRAVFARDIRVCRAHKKKARAHGAG